MHEDFHLIVGGESHSSKELIPVETNSSQPSKLVKPHSTCSSLELKSTFKTRCYGNHGNHLYMGWFEIEGAHSKRGLLHCMPSGSHRKVQADTYDSYLP